MKKIIKILWIITFVIIMFSSIMIPKVRADYDWNTKITSLNSATAQGGAVSSTESIVGAIISAVRIIAIGVAIIMLLILATKYMMAAPGDRADIKKHAVVYVVGAVILFATQGILGIIADFAEKNI